MLCGITKKTILKMKNKNQKKYSQTPQGKEALDRARKAYDERDPERRRRQKRDYMRRKRKKTLTSGEINFFKK